MTVCINGGGGDGDAPIRIQPFEPRFRDGVARLIVPIQREEFGLAVSYEEQPDLHDIVTSYQTGHGNFWVALTGDDTVVGSVALMDIGDAQAALRKMFVAPAYRGQPHLVARRLLTALLDHAASGDLRHIYLGTTDKFLAAHRFYEKTGFERIDPSHLPSRFPRMAVDSIFYHYKVQPRMPFLAPEEQIVQEILSEYRRAVAKFPTWPSNLAEAATVFGEEAGETVKAAAEAWWSGGDRDEVAVEAIQAAAMAIRLVVALRCGHYRFGEAAMNEAVDIGRYRPAGGG